MQENIYLFNATLAEFYRHDCRISESSLVSLTTNMLHKLFCDTVISTCGWRSSTLRINNWIFLGIHLQYQQNINQRHKAGRMLRRIKPSINVYEIKRRLQTSNFKPGLGVSAAGGTEAFTDVFTAVSFVYWLDDERSVLSDSHTTMVLVRKHQHLRQGQMKVTGKSRTRSILKDVILRSAYDKARMCFQYITGKSNDENEKL